MSRWRQLVLLISGSLSIVACAGGPPAEDAADTVYIDGRIYTVNDAQPWAEAVAIRGGKFLLVGSNAEAEAAAGQSTEIVDLRGAFVMPGIQENHVHASVAGGAIDKAANRVVFTPQSTPDQIEQALTDWMEANPGEGWIRGGLWGTAHFPNGQPHKSMLDDVVPDRPVVLLDETNHGAWVNSRALEIAGITADTPQPPTGVIAKDPETGEPTGFMADGGMTDVLVHVPQPTRQQYQQAIAEVQSVLHGYGITAMTDSAGGNRVSLEAYNALEQAGELKMRVDYVIFLNDFAADIVEPWEVIKDRERYRTRLLDPGRAKVGADGVPVSGASLFLEPFANEPGNHGSMTATDEELAQLVDAAGEGMQIMIHAMGDAVIRKALDVIEEARKRHPDNTRMAQIAHPGWPHPDDIPRFKELNVVADMSPPQYFWNPLSKGHVPVLGDERMKRTYPIREFLDAGVLVTYGSDWPAGTPNANPWRAMEGMVTRQNPEGDYPGEVMSEPISLEEAMRIFTINGAISMEHDDLTGSIEVGKYADMVVLDANPFELVEAGQADRIGAMSATRTLFEGEVVFDHTTAP